MGRRDRVHVGVRAYQLNILNSLFLSYLPEYIGVGTRRAETVIGAGTKLARGRDRGLNVMWRHSSDSLHR